MSDFIKNLSPKAKMAIAVLLDVLAFVLLFVPGTSIWAKIITQVLGLAASFGLHVLSPDPAPAVQPALK